MSTVLAQQHTTSKRVVFKSDNVSTHGVLDTQPSDSSFTRWATKARHLLSHFSLVAYSSGKRMVTGTRAWSRIKTKNFKRRLLPHHMSQRRDIWCTNRPIISCFNPKFVDLSVPYGAKQRRVNFRRSSATYRRSFGNHTLAGALCSGNILLEPAFSFTTFPLFYRAQLDSFPICITAF